MAEVLVATQDAAVILDDVPRVIEKGRTLADSRHPIVTDNPSLWKPLDVAYDVDDPDPEPEPVKKEPAAKRQPAGKVT